MKVPIKPGNFLNFCVQRVAMTENSHSSYPLIVKQFPSRVSSVSFFVSRSEILHEPTPQNFVRKAACKLNTSENSSILNVENDNSAMT